MTRHYLKVFKNIKNGDGLIEFPIVLEFCTDTNQINHKFVIQDDNQPMIRELKGFDFFISFGSLISLLYCLPNHFI